MPALYFFLRDNDDDDNGQKTPSANNDDYHSYKQVSVITLNKIHFISPEVNVVHTHFKVRAILRLIFTSGVLRARLLIENTCTRHNYIECISWMNPISIKSSAPEVKKETFRF